jgi:hypothetical protein
MAKREKDMQVNLEPAIHRAVIDLTRQLGDSQSNYIRKLIINDLRDRGLLTDNMLADLLVA